MQEFKVQVDLQVEFSDGPKPDLCDCWQRWRSWTESWCSRWKLAGCQSSCCRRCSNPRGSLRWTGRQAFCLKGNYFAHEAAAGCFLQGLCQEWSPSDCCSLHKKETLKPLLLAEEEFLYQGWGSDWWKVSWNARCLSKKHQRNTSYFVRECVYLKHPETTCRNRIYEAETFCVCLLS